jgi:hypothetical protein
MVVTGSAENTFGAFGAFGAFVTLVLIFVQVVMASSLVA